MNVVQISAGLGNQMFQYAFYMAMRNINNDIGIDTTEFKYRKHHNGYELERIFDISPRVLSRAEISAVADVSKSLIACIRRDWLHVSLKPAGSVFCEDEIKYYDNVWTMKNTYFRGFWQSWKYFTAVEALVRSEFKFKLPLTEINRACADAIAESESVSIHIRRGDYTKSRRWTEIGSICSLDYYNWALANIKQELGENVHYFVFSDDIEWVRNNLKLEHATYIDWNKGNESYNDMRLMSMCKHNIIANSSFSWWGAFLNANPDKIVIAPAKWYRNTPTPDLIPDGWILLPID